MAMTRIIHARKFYSRRWELTKFWTREVQRNPRRSRDHEDPEDDGMTDAERQEMYDYFKARDMVLPETRADANRMMWQSKRGLLDRRTKKVHADKFHRDLMERVAKRITDL